MARGPNYTGRVLGGRYAVGELLGEGGWGAVYAGVQSDLGRKVALKILHTDVALATEAVARFQREAKAAASFGHPNIVQVTDFQSNPNEPPFLVMEMLTGATLGAVLTRQVCLPQQRVASIMFQVLSALDVAHRAGIVHRDVKPDNVFLISMPGIEDFVKLLDFGIAKLSAEGLAQITDQGQLLGSPAFMSPEQVRSPEIDHRADIYSVGATMYYALAGRLPFDASSMPVLLTAIMQDKPKPLSEVAPSVDPRLAAIVERSLHKDPHGRFASAADMRQALEPFVGSHPGMGSTLESAPTAGPMPPTRPIIVQDAGPTYPAAGVGVGVGAYQQQPAGMITTGAPHVMSMSSASPAYAPIPMGPPMGSPPPGGMAPNPYGPSYGAQSSVASGGSSTSTSKGMSVGIMIALCAIIGLLVIGLIGGAGAFFYMRSDDKAAAIAQNGQPVSTGTVPGVPPTAATPGTPTGTGTGTSGALKGPNPPGPNPHPGPTPGPTPVVIVDAGGGKLATIDAGPSPAPPPSPTKKQMAGSVVKISGGSYGVYDGDQTRAVFASVNPQLNACYAATEFDPPDHQFTCWSFVVAPAGTVTSVKRSTDNDPLPKLDTCVIATLRSARWPANATGGTPQVCFASRTRDNP